MITLIKPSNEYTPGDPTAPLVEGDTLAELRATFEELKSEFADVISRRSAQASAMAHDAADATRAQISERPYTAMFIAVGAGALLALAVLPSRRQPPSRLGQLRDWGREWSPSQVSRADLENFAHELRQSAGRAYAAGSQPISSSFERVVDAVTKMDPKATLSPAIDKLGSWFSGVKASANKIVN